jgi:hypothetical protein
LARLTRSLPVAAILGFLAIQPMLVLVTALGHLTTASALGLFGSSEMLQTVASAGPGDPLYKRIALTTLTHVRPAGLVVREPVGAGLHAGLPTAFLSPHHVDSSPWIAAVLSSGSTLSAEVVVRFSGYAAMSALAIAVYLARHRAHGERQQVLLAALGILIAAQGAFGAAWSVLRLSTEELGALGMAHLAHLFTYRLNWLPAGAALQLATLTVVGASSLPGLLVLLLVAWPRQQSKEAPRMDRPRTGAPSLRRRSVVALLAATAAAVIIAPVTSRTDDLPALPGESVAASPPQTASVVTIEGEPFTYRYLVNGEPHVIRSLGYNVSYRMQDETLRERQYARDFAMIRGVGFNTILGWDQREFDQLTLDKAQDAGLGVIWPYHFPYDGAYEDPAFRRDQLDQVVGSVRRYMAHPSLRMWGLGDETVWGIGDPTSPRARAFASFLADVAEQVHQIDPNHPILYRDAEDMYLAPVKEVFRARGLEQPWFVYGCNVYTSRLDELMASWPSTGMRVPLFISEYSPTGYAPADRPGALVLMTRAIEDRPTYVLGGSVYTWSTAGLDPIDRVDGLVDESALPVDGSLDALRRAYAR